MKPNLVRSVIASVLFTATTLFAGTPPDHSFHPSEPGNPYRLDDLDHFDTAGYPWARFGVLECSARLPCLVAESIPRAGKWDASSLADRGAFSLPLFPQPNIADRYDADCFPTFVLLDVHPPGGACLPGAPAQIPTQRRRPLTYTEADQAPFAKASKSRRIGHLLAKQEQLRQDRARNPSSCAWLSHSAQK